MRGLKGKNHSCETIRSQSLMFSAPGMRGREKGTSPLSQLRSIHRADLRGQRITLTFWMITDSILVWKASTGKKEEETNS